ncbi:MAG TPA: 2,3-bisphosphoglycerate-independent phosphoglycerate mutase [Saprospiraceae bacterium]|nr:2,3-bisphosphoglycerate-independent phosphoglycerate mutase [Saprospiraceae bacterium]
MTKKSKKVALLILDGWGIGSNDKVSAIANANTPCFDNLMKNSPHAQLLTHGENVGLPAGQMGNSEVGHINIGAGRIVYQELARINKDMREGIFQRKEEWLKFINRAQNGNKRLHLMGLLSDGGVHSHINHLLEILKDLRTYSDLEIYIHAFLDGRDTDPKSGIKHVESLLENIENTNARLSTVIGRYYAMDRDHRWERTKKSYDLMVKGIGEYSSDIVAKIQQEYEAGITDEFMIPINCLHGNGGLIKNGDSVFFYNFRTDRPRQLTTILTQEAVEDFELYPMSLNFCTMTNYDDKYQGISVIYEKEDVLNTIGEILESKGKSQLRIAETEKYPHVTFFFSAGREEPFQNEYRIMVPSPKVATYDLAPEMSAIEITDRLLDFISDNPVDFICLNFANTDMVGHTGVFSAAVKAAETVDSCLCRIIKNLRDQYSFIVIADHGNSDFMINDDGTPNTAHTTNPVPIIVLDNGVKTVENGVLGDVAPTILNLMNIDIPKEMSGRILTK